MLRQLSFCSEEPYYDDDDPQEEYYSPEPQDGAESGANGAADEDADNIVPSGDPAAAAKDSLKSHKDKKIPNDQRTTTPYMTKYEKARILGTRALQIRYALTLALAVWAGSGWRNTSRTRRLTLAQHERSCPRRSRGRNRPAADSDQGAAREEGSSDCSAVHARWIVRLLTHFWHNRLANPCSYEDWTCEELLQ